MKLNKAQIVDAVREAGVVGAGGAGFPTHVKLQAEVSILIANGAECEPLLANDQALMVNATETLFEGLALAANAVGAARKTIAVKAKNRSVINHIKSRTGTQSAEIFELADYYPAGDEQEIVHEVTGATVAESGLPLDVGCVVQNIETLINIAQACDGKPVTHRVLTVVGEVGRPYVVKVPIGMSTREIIDQCGGLTCDHPVLYIGGPMMGTVQENLDQPITKTSSGIFVLPEDNFLIQKRSIPMRHILRQAQTACTNCMQCTDACPRYLLGHQLRPHKIMHAVTLGLSYQSDVIMEAFLCMFCGMCEFACPMWLSPRRVYAELRAELQSKDFEFQRSHKDYKDHPMRKYRRIPVERLIRRYELSSYAVKIPLEIRNLETAQVRIPTQQHLGAPAEPIVNAGDSLQLGQLIGEIPDGKLGARIHASIKGKVTYAGPDAVVIES
ncbi:SLBB domain-containing protein [bacterium]|nr:SLBB domain-containing protein [bacterium]